MTQDNQTRVMSLEEYNNLSSFNKLAIAIQTEMYRTTEAAKEGKINKKEKVIFLDVLEKMLQHVNHQEITRKEIYSGITVSTINSIIDGLEGEALVKRYNEMDAYMVRHYIEAHHDFSVEPLDTDRITKYVLEVYTDLEKRKNQEPLVSEMEVAIEE